MTDAAGHRPVILINPRLKDLPASSGIMQKLGRELGYQHSQLDVVKTVVVVLTG
ncbi:hypothetical protein QJS10_CPA02g01230 [Acorus calamus]|uniref:Uncharacterized protein n=1 Tax=Acorus calamus TaxID=4465 RepID=A0AAV9FD27_ACOCL|nr:hypothetical protein QJS10_CPA02g01230 [Acorus calamus]